MKRETRPAGSPRRDDREPAGTVGPRDFTVHVLAEQLATEPARIGPEADALGDDLADALCLRARQLTQPGAARFRCVHPEIERLARSLTAEVARWAIIERPS